MRRLVLSAASLALAVGLIALMPRLVGADWTAIWRGLSSLGPGEAAILVALWLAGLGLYTFVLTGSLPGLGHGQAFQLNAAGSAVSNLLPFGGAAGVAATFALAGSWGFAPASVAVSTLVSGVWNVFGRLLLPALGLAALLAIGEAPNRQLAAAAASAGALLLACAVLLGVALRWESAAHWVNGRLRALAARSPRRLAVLLRGLGSALLRIRAETIGVLRTGWKTLTFGMTGYLFLQGVLFWACLWAVGQPPRLAETVAAFALNRVLTSVVLTPGGTGVTETGTAAVLVHFGLDASGAATAVLLYSFFTYVVEIPLGGLAWAWWLHRRGGKLPDS
ncbi:lysylphosphatidylglycerol synthase domain-containing protein [Actinocorallia sp. A-T 12471]|uniref:lysylphosphatidylglycerol synthase domain-containing protein n=1 Tax=Actinocorallia sp. A-T 12471 TaxID=3089813 RepID=UPI0029CD008C|nr:lysylphosphatidylglycerol synthase domain-containing protein [Actinocorallia sp. A-T 12471]MDX6742505.1 lysylphosphatidylglycerol synthase domain-containing protein [Actinocorallia sp. A-T 12471]